mmetsp:Transcript_17825/g.31773  ORF Transcript_17825/g.31773 Transcript_17825/m.31773 type:complete len:667 (-) Transcript_17825:259-2259(-)
MGTDYVKRKAAKKKRKAAAAHGAPTVDADELDGLSAHDVQDGAKRERKKRSKIRRFCRGMCYSEPEKGLEGELLGDVPLTPADSGPDNDTTKKKKRRRSAKDGAGGETKSGGTTLSTGIGVKEFVPRSGEPDKRRAREGSGAELASQPAPIRRYLEAEGFDCPTEVQLKCWPILAEGRDAEVVAPTGSGKTLGFLLPALVRLQSEGCLGDGAECAGPLVLVLAPTREVAQQTASAARPMRGLFKLRCVALFGGASKEDQAARLSPAPHLLVATPGRLLDMLDAGHTTLDHLKYVVLDEADKLLSLGFSEQLERIRGLAGIQATVEGVVKKTKKTKAPLVLAPAVVTGAAGRPQMCLVTATMPDAVAEAAAQWLSAPDRVEVAHSGGAISAEITQVVQVCAEHKKPRKLEKHLAEIHASAPARNPPRILIFANRIKTVRYVHRLLSDAKLRVAMLHGERSQAEREDAMLAFRSGKANVLVATDVAGRGLHIRGLPYIVNYDFPSNIDAYVHRVGRTGRLAANGHAFSFFTRSLARLAPPVVSLLREHRQPVDPNLLILAEAWEEAVKQDPELAAALGQRSSGDEEDDGEAEKEEVEDEEDVSHEVVEKNRIVRDVKVKRHEGGERKKSGNEDDDEEERKKGPSGRRKALPGRLRKKLAKEKAGRSGR